MNAVIGALLPLIVTLGLGFFAAWRHKFTPEQALVLNRVVLLYALPSCCSQARSRSSEAR